MAGTSEDGDARRAHARGVLGWPPSRASVSAPSPSCGYPGEPLGHRRRADWGAVRLVPSETLGDDFLVPADAEFVIEGLVPPGERKLEGPFGEYTRYFGGQRLNPYMQTTAVTHRADAHWLADRHRLQGRHHRRLAPRGPVVRPGEAGRAAGDERLPAEHLPVLRLRAASQDSGLAAAGDHHGRARRAGRDQVRVRLRRGRGHLR